MLFGVGVFQSFGGLRDARGFKWVLVAPLLVSLACSASVNTAIGPQGSHVITCKTGMAACVSKATKLCGDEGYTILEGESRSKLLGGPSSSYRQFAEGGKLTVVCGVDLDEEEEPSTVTYKLPERTDEPLAEEPIEPERPPSSAAAPVCTPGATQACVGPGACKGGQVCLDSGRGFGLCDCGPGSASGSSSAQGPTSIQPAPAPEAPKVPGAAPAPTPLSQ